VTYSALELVVIALGKSMGSRLSALTGDPFSASLLYQCDPNSCGTWAFTIEILFRGPGTRGQFDDTALDSHPSAKNHSFGPMGNSCALGINRDRARKKGVLINKYSGTFSLPVDGFESRNPQPGSPRKNNFSFRPSFLLRLPFRSSSRSPGFFAVAMVALHHLIYPLMLLQKTHEVRQTRWIIWLFSFSRCRSCFALCGPLSSILPPSTSSISVL